MSNILNIQTLEEMETKFAILGAADYSLPVYFRVSGPVVECRVPTWSGIGDLLEKKREVMMVAVQNFEPKLRWLFLKGAGSIVKDPDWDQLVSSQSDRVEMEDLYQLLRIEPTRMEIFDEQRGWGYRETADF